MGRVENAEVIREHHFGLQLQPPIGVERFSELGEWRRREFKVSGNSWDFNSVDIATAGLGWLSLGLKGDATLAVWTYDGVDVKERNALILDRARFFENTGFTVSNVVSKADKKNQTMLKQAKTRIQKARKVRMQSERFDNSQEQKWHSEKTFLCIFSSSNCDLHTWINGCTSD